jgi:hypothetical protein
MTDCRPDDYPPYERVTIAEIRFLPQPLSKAESQFIGTCLAWGTAGTLVLLVLANLLR